VNRINGHYTLKFMYIHVIDKEPSSYDKDCNKKGDHTGTSDFCLDVTTVFHL